MEIDEVFEARIDSSPQMLDLARARCGDEVELRLGDMRTFEVDEPAGLVYCPFRSLNHLATWADRRAVFERVAAALRPGGRSPWETAAYEHTSTPIATVAESTPARSCVRFAKAILTASPFPTRRWIFWPSKS